MSLERAAAFAVRAALDDDLGRRVVQAAQGKTLLQAAMAVVRLAKPEGFDFTVDEALYVQAAMLGESDSDEGEAGEKQRAPVHGREPKLFESW